jgi:translation initiation factor IF-1
MDLPFEDLIQEGNISLTRAADTCSTMSTSFRHILGRMQMNYIRIPSADKVQVDLVPMTAIEDS